MIPIFYNPTISKAGVGDVVKFQLGSEVWAVCNVIGEDTKNRFLRLQLREIMITNKPENVDGIAL